MNPSRPTFLSVKQDKAGRWATEITKYGLISLISVVIGQSLPKKAPTDFANSAKSATHREHAVLPKNTITKALKATPTATP
jgi:hypothetical protein